MTALKIWVPFRQLILDFLKDDYMSWKTLMRLSGGGFFMIDKNKMNNFSGRVRKNSSQKKETKSKKRTTRDTRKRAWVKSFLWRAIGIVILGLISWLVTDSWKEMSMITVLFHGIRVILYYFHERVWDKIEWGRTPHPLSIFPANKPIRPEDIGIIQRQLKELGYLD